MSSRQSIAELAYQLWIKRGRPHGSEEEDWLEAKRRLAAGEETSERAHAVHRHLTLMAWHR